MVIGNKGYDSATVLPLRPSEVCIHNGITQFRMSDVGCVVLFADIEGA